ncbi:Holo-(acyl-carrier-protein) synthase [uncultured Sporomusa sp.]|uniref:Holo-[acyl-carrier-protein] synthase n=1 Tax=uncultured Sporomusa sp. TaxID=307249 RepID=A0A212LU35_9FIRM|nr:holo-ACP synthase [uncultured Sporomusa sp.]SCM80980.1 Holo-(acyl-carrier-protein) synthase [uncultured Sporomusa sp.]
MIIGIGMDIVEIPRIKAAIEREAFVRRVFTEAEAAYCRSRGVQQAASFAARFAAKEAVAKALGTGFTGGNIKDIEVVAEAGGKPSIVLHGSFNELAGRLGVRKIHVTLTHAREYAAAQAVAEGGR